MPKITSITPRGGTAADWSATDPVLANREIGVETDTRRIKVGNGASAWSALPYFGADAGQLTSGTIPDARMPGRLGTSPAVTSDWNNVITTGWFMASNAANQPVTNGGWFMGQVMAHNNLWVTQTLHQFTSDSSTDTKTWQRSSFDSAGARVWSSWYKVSLSSAEVQAMIDGKTYAISDISGLQTALDGKASISHSHSAATSSAAGFMPAADKELLDGTTVSAFAGTLVKRDSGARIHIGDPTVATNAATKGYVDGAVDGIVTGTPGKKYRTVACVIRNTGSGFEFISDAGHAPVGVTSVETYADRIVINYSFTATKVISAAVTPDETLAINGYTMGPSVGTSSMIIYVGQPGGFAEHVSCTNDTMTTLNGFITSMTRTSTAWQFNHAAILGPIGGQASYRGATYVATADSMSTTQTNVQVFNHSGTMINPTTTGANYRFWIMRSGTRRVDPAAELNLRNSNIWVHALMEI